MTRIPSLQELAFAELDRAEGPWSPPAQGPIAKDATVAAIDRKNSI